ncbi:MAG: CRTAC1 family protein [Gammaproteobacteria bacterium]|nr:CRTAC1 family protein [Gammaproteobacteria bacterium]
MTTKNRTILAFPIAVAAVSIYLVLQPVSSGRFVEYPLPLDETDRFFDLGIVDANGDDLLDIYTTNHHFRQALLLADGHGSYRDVVSEWGLDQSHEFPLAELSFTAPVLDRPGLYIYWHGTQVVIRTHGIDDASQWRGTMQVGDPVEIVKNDGFRIQKQDQASAVSETTVNFSPASDGQLRMRPGGQGLPITFRLDDAIPLEKVYVGLGKVSPDSSVFTLAMRDRHAMAWADYNNDGWLDVFINRGALGGTLRAHPEEVETQLNDELLTSHGENSFSDIATMAGIRKKGCSGRHARWLDFNHDGLLDLFINCYDRGNVAGAYPKQLYQQDMQGKLHDVAMEAGLGMTDQQIGSFAWFDADNDADVDLVTFQDEGFFLYRNNGDKFSQEPIYRRGLGDAEKIGHTTGNEWFYDGKVSVSDYDADGDQDLFSASKRGNVLLVNNAGTFSPVMPASIGLPDSSITGNWVDYDNDGLPDLHLLPQGLFRQREDHDFESARLLEFPAEQYKAAVANWYDIDNDGRLDLLMALSENPAFSHWWEFSREPRHSVTWVLKAYRNTDAANHWLQVKLVGQDGNRQAIGARVTVVTPDGRQVQEVGSTDGAFFSQGHYRLYFGLGNHTRADVLHVQWSDGDQQEFQKVSGDRLLTIERQAERIPPIPSPKNTSSTLHN